MEGNLYTKNGLDTENSIFESVDIERFRYVLKRSKFGLIFLIIASTILAYLYVRYTKPVYNSESIIKLEFESEANVLKFVEGLNAQKRDEVSGEIELIKSKLFLSRVAKAAKQDISYHIYGRYLTDERYKNAPFIVGFKIKNPAFYNTPFDIEFEDENSLVLSYTKKEKDISTTYSFDQEIITEDFNLYIEKTNYFYPDDDNRYFFVIKSHEELINTLQNKLEVFPKNFNAKTIVISYSDYNAHKARDMVNLIDSLYLNYTQEIKNLAITRKIDFLKTQVENTEKKISEYENYFERFTIDNRTTNLNLDIEKTIEQLSQLDSQHYFLKQKTKDIEFIQQQVDAKNAMTLNSVFLDKLPKLIAETIVDYHKFQQQRELKLNSYNETSFMIKRLDIQIKILQEILTNQLSSYSKSFDNKLSLIRILRNNLERNLSKMPSMGTEYEKNKRFYNLQKEFMFSLQTSKIELEIIQAGAVTKNIILSPASLPVIPIKPQKALIIGTGFVIGLVLSTIYLFIGYLIHNKIASLNEFEKLTNVPILGTIPHLKKKSSNRFSLMVKPNSKNFLSEALRTVRTNMDYINPKKEVKLISITSTIPGEGKTFIATNLGAIMAMSEQKVLVVDIDMRKPRIHMIFNGHKQNGVSTILSGKSEVKDCVQRTAIEGLSFISAGPTPPNPSELLLQNEFKIMLEEFSKNYDIIILDTPPIGLVTDGKLVMKYSDIQLYVVRANYSKKSFIKVLNNLKFKNQFSNIVAILNSSDSISEKYGYGYYTEDKIN